MNSKEARTAALAHFGPVYSAGNGQFEYQFAASEHGYADKRRFPSRSEAQKHRRAKIREVAANYVALDAQ